MPDFCLGSPIEKRAVIRLRDSPTHRNCLRIQASDHLLKMCIQIVERYAVCRCLFYKHSVDACPSYRRRGHDITIRDVLVGYACLKHSRTASRSEASAGYSDSGHSTPTTILATRASSNLDKSATDDTARLTNTSRERLPITQIRKDIAVLDTALWSSSQQDEVNDLDKESRPSSAEIGCLQEECEGELTRGSVPSDPHEVHTTASPHEYVIDTEAEYLRPPSSEQDPPAIQVLSESSGSVKAKTRKILYDINLFKAKIGVIVLNMLHEGHFWDLPSIRFEKPLGRGLKRVRWICVSTFHNEPTRAFGHNFKVSMLILKLSDAAKIYTTILKSFALARRTI